MKFHFIALMCMLLSVGVNAQGCNKGGGGAGGQSPNPMMAQIGGALGGLGGLGNAQCLTKEQYKNVRKILNKLLKGMQCPTG